MDKYELKMHDSINGVISALPRATPQESDQGIDHHLHITGMNIKLRAEKRSQNDKPLTIESQIAKVGIWVCVFFFNYTVILHTHTHDTSVYIRFCCYLDIFILSLI